MIAVEFVGGAQIHSYPMLKETVLQEGVACNAFGQQAERYCAPPLLRHNRQCREAPQRTQLGGGAKLRWEFLRIVRRRKKHLETEFIPDIDDPPTREPEPGRSLDTRIVLDALLRIDVKYRTPVELFYLSELSYKEIAETLKIPIGTVMSRLARGKEQLKSIVAKYVY